MYRLYIKRVYTHMHKILYVLSVFIYTILYIIVYVNITYLHIPTHTHTGLNAIMLGFIID